MSTHTIMDMHEVTHGNESKKLGALSWISIIASVAIIAILIWGYLAQAGGHGGGHGTGPQHAPPLWGLGILPFIAILGAIAFLPLIQKTQHWWESNLNRLAVALVCSGITLIYAFFVGGFTNVYSVLQHAVIAEYTPFIILLFALYVISGGIRLTGDLAAKPVTNTAFLAIGAGLASFIGTTGASMLLIRPLLQTNSERKHTLHTVIFFIFLVSNIGGTLLPIGDPPLFLGFLKGVDFWWTLNLWMPWAVCCAILLTVYFIWDSIAYKKETPTSIQRDDTERKPLRFQGLINIIWLLGVVCSVAFLVPGKHISLGGMQFTVFPFMREILMLVFVGLSLWTTKKGIRKANQFNYHAILEVAALFIGIFIAMQIPVEVLKVYGGNLGLTEPWHYFWATGSLSSFLDNAPTYVVFFETANASSHGVADPKTVISAPLLVGISLGAVFMGAMTYIGNGPNFMVKSIAEQSGIRMPSFFGYMFKYSIMILLPVFGIISVLFLFSWSPFHVG